MVDSKRFDGVKTFSATKAKEREFLGEVITDWIRTNDDKDVVDKLVTQSSDASFHCLTITLFYVFKPKTEKYETETWKDEPKARKS